MARARPYALGLTQPEAAHILACSVTHVHRLISTGQLTAGDRYQHRALDRDQVEQLVAARWGRQDRDAADTDGSYWVTRAGAAAILGVSPGRVYQLAEAGRLPYVETHNGQRIYRRAQLEVIRNARSCARDAPSASRDSDA